MMAKSPRKASGSVGSLKHKPKESEGLIPRTLTFIREQLPAWRDSPHRPQSSSENALNPSLCAFLDRAARLHQPMFMFFHQEPQPTRRSGDIGVRGTQDETVIGSRSYTAESPFLLVECKVVPQSDKQREREYVAAWREANGSPTGGIQRFKLGHHGPDLESSVIVGYLLSQSPDAWFTSFNSWISDFVNDPQIDRGVWKLADRLRNLHHNSERGIASAVSSHKRPSTCVSDTISLSHFWLEMSHSAKAGVE
jgi:hypothetical protein